MIHRIIDFSARNKFVVFLLVGVAVAAGWWSLQNVPLDAIPDLSDTQVIIYSRWDRSPDIMEDQVTYPIITALLGAPHVKDIRGFSDFGYSYVYIIFDEGTDIYWARSRTLEYLSKITPRLPSGVQTELGPDATSIGWVFQYALVDTTGKQSLDSLRSYQDWYLRYYLESVPGVAEVAPIGGLVRQYQIQVDPYKLAEYKIPLMKVVEAVRASNNDVGGRLVEFASREYMVRGRGYARSLDDLRSIVVGGDARRGVPITVKDVGQVTLGPGHSPRDRGPGRQGRRGGRSGDHALRRKRLARDRPREGQDGSNSAVAASRREDCHHLRPVRTHSALNRHAEAHAVRGNRHRQPGDFDFPLAHSQRLDSDFDDTDYGSDCLHSHEGDWGDFQHHVAGRNCHRHRRHGGRSHRGGGANAQEAGDVGSGRAASVITTKW